MFHKTPVAEVAAERALMPTISKDRVLSRWIRRANIETPAEDDCLL